MMIMYGVGIVPISAAHNPVPLPRLAIQAVEIIYDISLELAGKSIRATAGKPSDKQLISYADPLRYIRMRNRSSIGRLWKTLICLFLIS